MSTQIINPISAVRRYPCKDFLLLPEGQLYVIKDTKFNTYARLRVCENYVGLLSFYDKTVAEHACNHYRADNGAQCEIEGYIYSNLEVLARSLNFDRIGVVSHDITDSSDNCLEYIEIDIDDVRRRFLLEVFCVSCG